MDFNKLDSNDKMAAIGAVIVFLAGLISNWGGLFWLAVLAAIGMAAVLFLPQLSPSTSLPGSKGTLMATLGFVALGAGVIELLRYLQYVFSYIGAFNTLVFIVALVGAAMMAWAGWQALQAEGGKWQFGAAGTAGAVADRVADAASGAGQAASDAAGDATSAVADAGSAAADAASSAVDSAESAVESATDTVGDAIDEHRPGA